MKKLLIIIFALLIPTFTVSVPIFKILKVDGTIDPVKLELVINYIFNNFQEKKHTLVNVVPSGDNIGERYVVFYSTSDQVATMYVVLNGKRFSFKNTGN